MTLDDVLPRVLPFGWNPAPVGRAGRLMPGAKVFTYKDGLSVIATLEEYPDKSKWFHVSFSYPNRLPSWETLKAVKNLFFGKDKLVIQLLPREEEYLNYHPYCLHLYRRMDADTLPGLAPNDRTLT